MISSIRLLVVLFFAVPCIRCQNTNTSDTYDLARNRLKCATASTCRECMQLDKICVWCSDQVNLLF